MSLSISEFYEKYVRLSNRDKPPQLTEKEKLIIDTAWSLGVNPFILAKGRGPTHIVVNPVVEEHINKKQEMENHRNQPIKYWKSNAQEDYSKTPISVLKYITVLEETISSLREAHENTITWQTDNLPEPQSISQECNDYYLVKIKGYAHPTMAMYMEDEEGNVGWYVNYTAKIVKEVTAWANVE